jgi:hypothetical protein
MFDFNEKKWAEAMMDMPFGRPGGLTQKDAVTKPGNCVKSVEREQPSHRNKYFGRILKYDTSTDEVIVLSHADGWSKKFVWTGTVHEFDMTWSID